MTVYEKLKSCIKIEETSIQTLKDCIRNDIKNGKLHNLDVMFETLMQKMDAFPQYKLDKEQEMQKYFNDYLSILSDRVHYDKTCETVFKANASFFFYNTISDPNSQLNGEMISELILRKYIQKDEMDYVRDLIDFKQFPIELLSAKCFPLFNEELKSQYLIGLIDSLSNRVPANSFDLNEFMSDIDTKKLIGILAMEPSLSYLKQDKLPDSEKVEFLLGCLLPDEKVVEHVLTEDVTVNDISIILSGLSSIAELNKKDVLDRNIDDIALI